MNKRSISLIVSLLILIYTFQISAADIQEIQDAPIMSAEPVESVTDIMGIPQQEHFEFLSALGIIKGDADGNFYPDAYITRAELATVMCRITGQDGLKADVNNMLYKDVPSDYWAYNEIMILSNQKILGGDTDGYFVPEGRVLTEHAAKVLVNILGYTLQAESWGSYPNGYLAVAKNLGILKNVNAEMGKPLNRSQIAVMICNALDVDIVQQTGYGSNPTFSKEDGKTLLTERMKVYHDEGILEATSVTTLTEESSLRDGEVQINGKIYLTGSVNADKYLGYYIKYYYKELDKDLLQLVYIKIDPKNNNTLEIDSENIERADRTNIYYFLDKDGKNIKNAKISPIACMIYNGKAFPDFTIRELMPEMGKVVLIDHDDDDEYDIVLVTEYKTVVLRSIFSDQNELVLMDRYDSSRNVTIDTKNSDIEVYKDGEKISINNLEEWDVLNIITSDHGSFKKSKVKIIINSVPVGGEIQEESDEHVVISGFRFKIAKSYQNLVKANRAPKLTVQKAGTFYLNLYGEIAAMKEISMSTYGYLTKIAIPKGLDNNPLIKVYTIDGVFSEFVCSEKMAVNDLPQSLSLKKKLIEGGLCKEVEEDVIVTVPQLIKFKLDEDSKVVHLYTAADLTANGTRDTSGLTDDEIEENARNSYFAKRDAENNDIFRLCYKGEVNYRGSVTFSGKVYPTSETKIFVVPEDKTEEKSFQIQSINDLSYDASYNIESYDESVFNVPKVMVINLEGAGSQDGDTDKLKKSSFVVVQGVGKAIINDEECTVIKGLQNGNTVKLPFTAEVESKKTSGWANCSYNKYKHLDDMKPSDTINFGDILQVTQDTSGNVTYITEWYDLSLGIFKSKSSEEYRQDWRTVIAGQVEYVGNGGNYIIVNDRYFYSYDLTRNPVITVVELDKKIVRPGVRSEIFQDDYVVMRIRETAVHEVVVFKGLSF